MMNENEMSVRLIARGCHEGTSVEGAIRDALTRLSEALELTHDGVVAVDWSKVITLRMAIAAAVGCLEGTELHV